MLQTLSIPAQAEAKFERTPSNHPSIIDHQYIKRQPSNVGVRRLVVSKQSKTPIIQIAKFLLELENGLFLAQSVWRGVTKARKI